MLDLFFLAVCSYHVTYAFQSESTLYSCLNVEELLARNRCDIYNLSDCNGTWTHNHELSGCGFESCCSHINLFFFLTKAFIWNYSATIRLHFYVLNLQEYIKKSNSLNGLSTNHSRFLVNIKGKWIQERQRHLKV